MTTAIEFRDVTKCYGNVRAVDGVRLQIEAGEFFAMLGPSGSGKTTCLRLIAGFEAPDSGQILLDDNAVTALPPYERDVNTVFQDYALFPHMTVLENVAYGLRVRKVSRAEQQRRALEMLALVKLDAMAPRRPHQLSGGQRQRVSLARALINQPRVLLLDEPLGALDLKLREEMQIELKNLQRRLGITFVFVTHDQGEALSMADRIAVFDRGRIEQLDTPRGLYTRPNTAFVAKFVGGANVIEGALAQRLAGGASHDAPAFAVRAENILLGDVRNSAATDVMRCEGTIVDVQYHGAASRYQVRLSSGELLTAAAPDSIHQAHWRVDSAVSLSWSRDAVMPLQAAAASNST